jgi:hypothetical protein
MPFILQTLEKYPQLTASRLHGMYAAMSSISIDNAA